MKQQILNFGKESLIYGLGSLITRFIGLFTLPIFTAYLKPEEYGVLAMLALLTMVAQPVFSLGLSAAMGPSYFERDDPLNKSNAVWTAFAINTVSATVLVLISWLFPVTLGQFVHLSAEHAPLVGLSLTGTGLCILVTSFMQRVQFEKQAMLYVAATFATALTAILVSVITVVYFEWGVKGMVIGQLAGNIATALVFLLIGIKGTKPSVSLVMAKELLRQGLPLVPSFAFLFVLMHANKFILEQQAGLEAVGIYSIGFIFGMAMSVVTGGITTAWFPFFMSFIERQSEARVLFGRIFTYYVFGVGSLTLFFFIVARPAIMLLTDEAYHHAYIVVGLVASANYFSGMYSLFLTGVYYKKEIAIQSAIQGCAVLFSFPLTYFLIVYFGVLGAAVGLSLGHLFLAVFTHIWNLYRQKSYGLIDYEWKRIFLFTIIYLATTVCFLTFENKSLIVNLFLSCLGLVIVIIAVSQLLSRSEITFVPGLRLLKF